MEAILLKIAAEAPNTVALLIVVLLFLRYLERQNKRYDVLDNHSRTVIEANTKAMAQVVEVMRGCPENK